jgi:hypothetical protein
MGISATMESSQQADLENIIGALQSNRSLNSISISRDVLAISGKRANASLSAAWGTYVANVGSLGRTNSPPLFTRRYSLIRYPRLAIVSEF